MQTAIRKPVLIFSLLIAVLIMLSDIIAIPTLDFYAQESVNWTLQSVGQDLVDLFLVVPLLMLTAIAAFRNRKAALLMWGGVVFYLIYTYTIYCFALHFNRLFIVYCLILGLCFYGFVYYLYALSKENVKEWFKEKLAVKFTGIYFIVIAILFYALWLMQVIPPVLANTIPKDIKDIGLLVNPVHVIDLSVCLPALFITGVLLLKRHNLGFILTPVMLMFCIIMDITIGVLAFMMREKGMSDDVMVIVIMALLTVLSSVLLVQNLRALK